MKIHYIIYILKIFVFLKHIEATFYFSDQILKTYNEAEELCKEKAGRLLGNIPLINDVVKKCTQNGTKVWSGFRDSQPNDSPDGKKCQVMSYDRLLSPKTKQPINCNSQLTFICKVGVTDDIQCSFKKLLRVETDVQNASKPSRSESKKYIIIGLAVLAGLLFIGNVVIFVFIVRMRFMSLTYRKKSQTATNIQDEPTFSNVKADNTTSENGYFILDPDAAIDSADASRDPSDNQPLKVAANDTGKKPDGNVDATYDSSRHGPASLNVTTNSNIYDHSCMTDDTYDVSSHNVVQHSLGIYDHT